MFQEETKKQKRTANKADNIFTRIAKADNTTLNKAQKLLVDNGIKKASNRLELYYKLIQLYKMKREAIIPSIIEIHPDKKLFEEYYKELAEQKIRDIKNEYEKKINELKLDLRFEGVKKYGDDGSTDTKSIAGKNSASDYLPYMALISAVGLFSITIISITKSKG